MAPSSVAGNDPFADPERVSADRDYAEASTLPVGRNASLTLATDSLIVLGKSDSVTFTSKTKLTKAQTKNSREERLAIAVVSFLLVGFTHQVGKSA